jgi:uncharacterized protein YukE
MPDEYYERYKHLTHQELYAKLHAGVPGQVDGLATAWKSIQDTANELAAALRRDLDRLQPRWDSAAGREFQRRMELIAGYAQSLAGDFDSMRSGLTTMSGALTEALRKAESPDKTDDLDKTISGAAKGAAIGAVLGPAGSVVGGVVGGALGHNKDEEEQEKARERMVVLVSWLAAEYGVTDHGTWPAVVSPPPVGLPEGDPHSATEPTAVGPVTRPDRAPSTKPPGDGGAKRRPDALPHAVTPLGDGGTPPGSGLPDNSGGVGTTLPAWTSTDSDQLGTGLLGAGTDPLTGVPGGAGSGGLTGGVGTSGVASAGVPSGTGLGASSLTGATAGHVLGASSGDDSRGSAGAQRSATATTGRVDGRSAAAGGGSADGDGTDEHLTWLTEDDMVWGTDDDAPPAVLGEARPASAPVDPSAERSG